MRWFRFGLGGGNQVQHDPARQEALLQDLRHRFGANVRVRFADQVDAITPLLGDDDGLVVAARIVHEVAEEAHADVHAQTVELYRRTGYRLPFDRRNYLPLWKTAGPQLRWSLFVLRCGFHPYVQVAAAVRVLGAEASRFVQATEDPNPLLAHLFEVLDLNATGWEYARVRLDVDAAALAAGLITATQQIRAEMDDPPPLPPSVRARMRRNNTFDVYSSTDNRVVGGLNLGAELRAALLA